MRQDVGSLSPLATNTGMAHSPTASYWACHVPILQSGHHAARTIMRRLRGQEPRPFRYRNLGTMATISRFRAVAGIGPIRIAGLAGWLLWLLVHLVFITGFKNRVAAVADWAVAFLGRGRRQRTITEQQVLARARALAKATTPR